MGVHNLFIHAFVVAFFRIAQIDFVMVSCVRNIQFISGLFFLLKFLVFFLVIKSHFIRSLSTKYAITYIFHLDNLRFT